MSDTYTRLPTPKGGGGGGTSDHALLTNLDYASANHIGFQPALGFTAENVANKDTTTTLGSSDTKYPSQKAVKTYVDTAISGVASPTLVGTANQVIITGTTTKTFSTPQNIATSSSPTFAGETLTGFINATLPKIVFANKTTGALSHDGLHYDDVGQKLVQLQGTASYANYSGSVAEFSSTNASFIQMNIQNQTNGNDASADYVITADNGTDATNFTDLGINNSGFTSPTWTLNGADDGYVYTSDGNFAVGTGGTGKELALFTGGTLAANKRVVINDTTTTNNTLFDANAGIKTNWVTAKTDLAGISFRKIDAITEIFFVDTTNSKINVPRTTASTSITTGCATFAGGVGIAGDTYIGGKVTAQAATTAGSGAELITAVEDRDFSGAGNWTGTNWSLSGGKWVHTAGANATGLANSKLNEAPIAGEAYLIVLTLDTTTAGTISVSFGGTTSSSYGQVVATNTALSIVLVATNTNPILISPNAAWAGSIDDISIKRLVTNGIASQLKDSSGVVRLEERPISATSIAVGTNALVVNQGVNNTAFGNESLKSAVSATNNTAFGYNNLTKNVKAGNNTAFGAGCMPVLYQGTSNSAFGASSLAAVTTGSNNSAFGGACLGSCTAGGNNCAMGVSAINSLTTANNTVGLGYASLPNITTGSGNVGIGVDTAYTVGASLTTVSNCTFVGYQATSTTNAITNSSAVGYGAQVAASNSIQLGNASVTKVNTKTAYYVNDVKVVGAQVAAIGLDADTDTNKITAIIACLRAHGLMGPNV